jgi:hypothetical protein
MEAVAVYFTTVKTNQKGPKKSVMTVSEPKFETETSRKERHSNRNTAMFGRWALKTVLKQNVNMFKVAFIVLLRTYALLSFPLRAFCASLTSGTHRLRQHYRRTSCCQDTHTHCETLFVHRNELRMEATIEYKCACHKPLMLIGFSDGQNLVWNWQSIVVTLAIVKPAYWM